MNANHIVIPVFVPHKGCPHDCSFCNQKKISGQVDEMTMENMHFTIESHLKTIRPGSYVEIGFYGGSFTGIEKRQQLEFLEAADKYVRSGRVAEIRLSTRPDYIDDDILDYLGHYHVRTIELGVQSLDDSVLAASNRGHTSGDVFRAASLIKARGFKLGIQTMVGLPMDTREKDIETARKVIGLSPAVVRIYPVLVIRGTYLECLLKEGKYAPPSLDEAVDICAELLDLYEAEGIDVIRVGLQASESINEGAEVAAGPVHPAFRQLVEARRALRCIEAEIAETETVGKKLEGVGKLVVRTGKRNISNVIGQKRANIEYLKRKYSIGDVRVVGEEALEREIRVEISD